MSNYSSSLEILIKLIGFEEINNGDKICLPDEVEINTLIVFNDYVVKFKNDRNNVKTFWTCNQCTYRNQLDSATCQMCGLPGNVCHYLFYPKHK